MEIADYFAMNMKYDKFIIPSTDKEINLRHPSQVEIEEHIKDSKKRLGKNYGNHSFSVITLMKFWDDSPLASLTFDEATKVMSKLTAEDCSAIVAWFMGCIPDLDKAKAALEGSGDVPNLD